MRPTLDLLYLGDFSAGESEAESETKIFLANKSNAGRNCCSISASVSKRVMTTKFLVHRAYFCVTIAWNIDSAIVV